MHVGPKYYTSTGQITESSLSHHVFGITGRNLKTHKRQFLQTFLIVMRPADRQLITHYSYLKIHLFW